MISWVLCEIITILLLCFSTLVAYAGIENWRFIAYTCSIIAVILVYVKNTLISRRINEIRKEKI